MPAVVLALVIALTTAPGAGVVYSTQDALPGDALYQVKQAVEAAQVAIALDPESKAGAHLAIAEKKLKEVGQLQAKPAVAEGIAKAADQLARHQQAAENALEKAALAGKDVDKIVARLKANSERQQAILTSVLDKVPEQAKEAIKHALAVSQRGLQNAVERQTKSRGATAGKPEGADRPEGAGKPQGVGHPEGVGRPDGAGRPEGAGRAR